MCGGWNTVQCFNDLYILDLGTLVWSTLQNATGDKWGPNRWNHSLIAVEAVPHWKLFCFGGNTGNLEEGDPQGTYSNTLRVLETGSNEPDQWVDQDGNTGAPTPDPRPATRDPQPSPASKLTQPFHAHPSAWRAACPPRGDVHSVRAHLPKHRRLRRLVKQVVP